MERLPHAALDTLGRLPKAAKIQRLLGDRTGRLLEVGTGSGAIASYFARLPPPGYAVDAVDTLDQRQMADGYAFQRVEGTRLPFAQASFDVVISNHVIEHVGEPAAQLEHLAEIRRVLRPDGLAYLAVPSRWQLVEPHYGLAFLSWLPRPLRSPYLRLSGKGAAYDCRPLSKRSLEGMLRRTGWSYRNALPDALDFFVRDEGAGSLAAKLAHQLPAPLIHRLAAFSPTHAYLLQHPRG